MSRISQLASAQKSRQSSLWSVTLELTMVKKEEKKKTELHASSNKLCVCACVHAHVCVPVQPLPPVSIYTYTPRLYTYMYIYTAYVQIEKKNIIGGGYKRGRLCFPSSTSSQSAAAVAPPSSATKQCLGAARSARGGGWGLGNVVGLGKGPGGRGITCSSHPIVAGAR